MCRTAIDKQVISEAICWGVMTGRCFNGEIYRYNFNELDEQGRYYLAAFYNIYPGLEIQEEKFMETIDTMHNDEDCSYYISRVLRTCQSKRYVFDSRKNKQFTRLHIFM